MNLIIEFFQFACSGFWIFIGVLLLSSLLLHFVVNGILALFTRFFRLITVALRGWPPSHLDADGDWKKEPKNDEI